MAKGNKNKKSAKDAGNKPQSQPKSGQNSAPVPSVSNSTELSTVQAPTNPPAALKSKPTMKVQPEQTSLLAHSHIQAYLKTHNQSKLTKNDVTAVLRLSQHLRVFGLLSAVGYVNQSNEQRGEVRERTVPVWESLLGQFMTQTNPNRAELMRQVTQLAQNNAPEYIAQWRKVLTLSKHWNFWARAYAEKETK